MPPSSPPTRLEQIVASHRAAAAIDDRPTEELVDHARDTHAPRDFGAALRTPGLSVIAEIKRRSPSMGDLSPDLDPAELARQYEAGGAACISVLTDEAFFGGSIDDLQRARSVVDVPVLRKDFTVDERDVLDARIMGADAVLLIVAALTDDELHRFAERARQMSLAALFEVHDEEEVARAVRADATIIGVNQRNLHTFEIDRSLAARLRPLLPDNVISVAESGVRDASDARALADAGYDAVLVGTSLVTASGADVALSKMVND